MMIDINLKKIMAEKNNPLKGGIKISNNVNIAGMEKTDNPEIIKILFKAKTVYENIGSIEMEGELIWLSKNAKEILEFWEKENKLKKEEAESILNSIINYTTIEALLIAKEMKLPSPIKIPRVKVE